MKKIANQFALFVLVMFGLQASARTCAFMQVGGVIEEAALSKVVSTPKSAGPSSPQSIAISSLALCPPQPNPLLSIPLKKRQVLLVAGGI